jgi:hypothetical protein
MKRLLLACAAFSLAAAAPLAQAAASSYNVVTTWLEPETAPNDSIFVGSFDYDAATKTVSNLKGVLSESMTGGSTGYPNDSMIWLTLGNQLVSWYDAALGGTFAATFRNPTTSTFTTTFGSNGWSPGEVVYAGFPNASANPGNAYALIFIPDNPLAALTQAQIDKLAYADCAPGGMMGATCMTGTSEAGYGLSGSMGGYPVSQTITAAVPEPETYAMMMAGLGLVGFMARRRRKV